MFPGFCNAKTPACGALASEDSALQKRLSAAIRQQLQGLDPAPGEVSGKTVGTRLGLRPAGWNEGRKCLRKVTV